MKRLRPLVIALSVVVGPALGLSACGSGGDDADKQRLQDERVATAKLEGERQARLEERLKEQARRQRQTERQLRAIKNQGKSSGSTGGSTPAPAAPAPSSPGGDGALKSCDANVQARADTTTCTFAQNTFYEYYVSGRSSTITAFSPTNRNRVSLSCIDDGTYVTCRGGSDAVVRFSIASVDNYTDAAAARFAAGRDLG